MQGKHNGLCTIWYGSNATVYPDLDPEILVYDSGVGEGGQGGHSPPHFSERGRIAPPLFKICDVAANRVPKMYKGKSK